MNYQHILFERRGAVGIVRLNRPAVLNALNSALMEELAVSIGELDDDDQIGAIVITGNDKAFAAGADIREMKDRTYPDLYRSGLFQRGQAAISRCRKPVIAAVSGYALGGGCELAMMCDFIIAGDTARFGQPEVTLGILPGLGGTQRLTRLVGKAKAMEMCLTGRMMDAAEAERSGLVSRVVPAADLMTEVISTAEKIAAMSRSAIRMIKESVNRAYETTLAEGLLFEHRLFQAAFATEDQKEGMGAFVEKRKPHWKNR